MHAVSDMMFPDNHQRRTPRPGAWGLRCLRALAVLAVLLGTASGIEAQTPITLAWDPNTEPDVAGYQVSYGNQSGVYSTHVDVGNATSMPFTPTVGVVYYFAVKAYNSANPHVYSPFSAEVAYGVAHQ